MKKLKADIDEMSTSGASGGYNTPYAFRLPGSKPNDKEMLDLGYTPVKEALSGDQREGLIELQGILDRASQLGEEAKDIVYLYFPSEMRSAEAYDIFNFGSSANQYDNTLESFINTIEQSADEYNEDELDEAMQGFEPHFMYKDGEKIKANTKKDHLDLKSKGYDHSPDEMSEDLSAYHQTPMKMGHLDTNDDGVKKPIYFNYGYKLVDKSKS